MNRLLVLVSSYSSSSHPALCFYVHAALLSIFFSASMLFAKTKKIKNKCRARIYCKIFAKCQKAAYFHAKSFAKHLILCFKSAIRSFAKHLNMTEPWFHLLLIICAGWHLRHSSFLSSLFPTVFLTALYRSLY